MEAGREVSSTEIVAQRHGDVSRDGDGHINFN